MHVFAVNTFYARKLTAIFPATYMTDLLQSTKNTGPDELIDSFTVEQTPNFDVRNPAGVRGILVAMLEDDDKVERDPNEHSDSA